MRVILVASTGVNYGNLMKIGYDPHLNCEPSDELGEAAGRLCYLSYNRPNPETSTNESYLANIINQGHFSVLEHSSATFYIDGVSRNFTHELIRHRHLSFSEVSQRYVDISEFKFINHPELEDLPIREYAQKEDLVLSAKSAYRNLIEHLLSKGYKRKEARQASRFVMPSGLETKILVTGNMRAWRDMLPKRLSPTADKEFQEVAREILRQLKEVAPNTFQGIN